VPLVVRAALSLIVLVEQDVTGVTRGVGVDPERAVRDRCMGPMGVA
jgi:hypothetical protein